MCDTLLGMAHSSKHSMQGVSTSVKKCLIFLINKTPLNNDFDHIIVILTTQADKGRDISHRNQSLTSMCPHSRALIIRQRHQTTQVIQQCGNKTGKGQGHQGIISIETGARIILTT